MSEPRRGERVRATKETRIAVNVNLDGDGEVGPRVDIETDGAVDRVELPVRPARCSEPLASGLPWTATVCGTDTHESMPVRAPLRLAQSEYVMTVNVSFGVSVFVRLNSAH